MDVRFLKLNFKDIPEGISMVFENPPEFFRTDKGKKIFAETIGTALAYIIHTYEKAEDCNCESCKNRKMDASFEVDEIVIAKTVYHKSGILAVLKGQTYQILELHEDGLQVKIYPEEGDPVFVPKILFDKKH